MRSGNATVQPCCAQHVERLRRRHLVDEVQADEQLRLSARQHADGVRVPDLLKECVSHMTALISTRFRGGQPLEYTHESISCSDA